MHPHPPREFYPDFSGKCHLNSPGDRTTNLKQDPLSVSAAKNVTLNHHEHIPSSLYIPSPIPDFLRISSPLQYQSGRVVCSERGGESILRVCGIQSLRPLVSSIKLGNQQFHRLVLWNDTARDILPNIYKRGQHSEAVNCFREAELPSSILVIVVIILRFYFLLTIGF